VAANNEYNDPGRDSNKPASAQADCLSPSLSALTLSHLSRQASSAAAAATTGGKRRSLSQHRLTLQITGRGGVTEQLSDHLCNYDRQPVTVVSGPHFITQH